LKNAQILCEGRLISSSRRLSRYHHSGQARKSRKYPIGKSDYKNIIDADCFLFDKTRFIKTFFDNDADVILYCFVSTGDFLFRNDG